MEPRRVMAGAVALEVLEGGRHDVAGPGGDLTVAVAVEGGSGSAAEVSAAEEALVVAAIGGDRRAQEALFRVHFQRVRRRVARLLGPDSEVEDVVQETFLKAFQELRKLKEKRAFGGWILAIAVHLVSRRLRRRRMLRRLGFVPASDGQAMVDAVPSHGPSPARLAEARGVYTRLDRLPAEARVAFLLRWLEGLTVPEVAREMNLSERTVKRRIANAEACVAQILDLSQAGGGA